MATTLLSLSSCGKKKKEEPIHIDTPYHLSLDSSKNIQVDNTGYGEYTYEDYSIGFSRAETTSSGLIKLLDRGVIINLTGINDIKNIEINFSSLDEATLYYGDYFLSFTHSVSLKQNNLIDINSYCSYFVIQSSGESIVSDLTIGYMSEEVLPSNEELPTFTINTELDRNGNPTPVKSRTSYVSCSLSFTNPRNESENVNDLPGQIKVRGNSTTLFPKFGYRLKLDSKHSFFGLKKNKSWVLLADYLDASKMHNYSALSFAKMVRRDTNTFANSYFHVRYFLNGKDMGLFFFSEHINENKNIMNLEQDKIWEKSFDEINFYMERDLGVSKDYRRKEDVDFFRYVNPSGYPVEQYFYDLKYPLQEDFYEYDDNDNVINTHEAEYTSFFNQLKEYICEISRRFVNYYYAVTVKEKIYDRYQTLDEMVDLYSLALFDVTDQMFCESDHAQKSFKLYRKDGGKLMFGPNWDYDSCVDSIFYVGETVLFPYEEAYYKDCKATWFGEQWGRSLFLDEKNGRLLYKSIWSTISEEDISNYLSLQLTEMRYISSSLLDDTKIWMNNVFHGVFDCLTFHYKWISTQIRFLKDFFAQ